MEITQGETILATDKATQSNDDSVKGTTIRQAEIEAVKSHAEELQKSISGAFLEPELVNRGTEPKPLPEAKPSSKLKLYTLYCEPCGYKRLMDGSNVTDLIPYKQAMIPGGSPYRDPATGEIKTPPSRPNSKKFKCPNCGRVATVRKVADPNTTTGRSFDE